jgi:hypothetical protein
MFFLQIYNTIPEAEEAEPDEPQKPKLSNKEIYANLKKYLASIKESCGQVWQNMVSNSF